MEDDDGLVQIPHEDPLEGQRGKGPALLAGTLKQTSLRKEDNVGGELTAQPELRVLTSRSLSGGGEGLFLRDLPRDLDPPLRHARSSSSLMGVDGL